MAIAVRLAIATEVEPYLAGRDKRARTALGNFADEVRQQTDKLLNEEPEECGKWLDGLKQFLVSYAFPSGLDSESVASLLAAQQRLLTRVGGIGPVRSSGADIDVHRCMPEVFDLLSSAENEVSSLYERFTERLIGRQIVFSTERTDLAATSNMWQHFHVSGSTSVSTDSSEPTLLCVHFRDKSFTWRSLCQLRYVLVHELTCHAYQGIEGPEPRFNAEDACIWSEGWMDGAAWTIVERWIQRDPRHLPVWFSSNLIKAQAHCRSFHDRRYEPPQGQLREEDILDRERARSAYGQLRSKWSNTSTENSSDRATDFSLLLNLYSLSHDTRRRITECLSIAMLAYDSQSRIEKILQTCRDFTDHRDPVQFDEALHDACFGRDLPSTLDGASL